MADYVSLWPTSRKQNQLKTANVLGSLVGQQGLGGSGGINTRIPITNAIKQAIGAGDWGSIDEGNLDDALRQAQNLAQASTEDFVHLLVELWELIFPESLNEDEPCPPEDQQLGCECEPDVPGECGDDESIVWCFEAAPEVNASALQRAALGAMVLKRLIGRNVGLKRKNSLRTILGL